MKAKNTKMKKKDRNRPLPDAGAGVSVPVRNDSALFLAVLFALSGFLALSLFAVGEASDAFIEADTKAIPVWSAVRYRASMERDLGPMVTGHPIEEMVPYIAKRDVETAKFLVSIAKKESNWGKYSPKDATGATCYNYWGYRGRTENVTRSGYSCFGSPEEAVSVVGDRLDYLIHDLSLDSAEKLIVWKCGWSCVGHDGYGVAKWIGDVDYYAKKIDSVRENGSG